LIFDAQGKAAINPDADLWALGFDPDLVPAVGLSTDSRNPDVLDVADVAVALDFRHGGPVMLGAIRLEL
jgi:hypothetical protein